MNRAPTVIALSAIVLAASAGTILAQPADAPPAAAEAPQGELPGGWDVLDRAVEAMGGVDRFTALKNFVATGTFSMPAMGIEGSIVRTQAAPGSLHMRIDLGAMGEVVQACDGETAWGVQPGMTAPIVLTGKQAEEMIATARFYDRVHPREKYESAETVGVEDLNGRPCYRVSLTEKSGSTSVAFYDTETGHQVRIMSRSSPEAENFDVIVDLSDFREVDGLVHPFLMKQKMGGQEFTIQFESFVHDTTIDDAIFAPPTPVEPEVPEGEI